MTPATTTAMTPTITPLLTGTHLGILGLSTLGFIALALATERHAEHLLGRLLGHMPAARWRHLMRLARLAGWLLLALSLAWAIADLGTGIGITLWLGWLSIGALALVFALPHWPWQPAIPQRPARKNQAGAPSKLPPAPVSRTRRAVAAGLLAATAAVFTLGLARVETAPLQRPDALQGQVGPWTFTLAQAHQGPPQAMEMDIPMKEFRLRFCAACDADIRQAFLKIHRPRSDRATGMAFIGSRWERRVEIPLPATTRAGSELWITAVGKDGRLHQTALRMDQVAPATVQWFEQQRKQDATP